MKKLLILSLLLLATACEKEPHRRRTWDDLVHQRAPTGAIYEPGERVQEYKEARERSKQRDRDRLARARAKYLKEHPYATQRRSTTIDDLEARISELEYELSQINR